jgi:hypothetical protein
MQMQAPTLTTTHRQPLFVVVAALVVAAIVAGVIALATRDDSSTSAIPAKPASAQSTDTRVLDGSPLLRGASAAPAVTITTQSGLARVWDGSPILRGSSAVPHSGGGPARLGAPTSSLAGTTSSQSQSQFPVRPPEGFHRAP